MTDTEATPKPIRLGLRANLAQFSLLVGVNALVGGMIGQERTVLPLLATEVFGLTAFTATLTFIAAFGIVKAATNFFGFVFLMGDNRNGSSDSRAYGPVNAEAVRGVVTGAPFWLPEFMIVG